MNLKEQTVYIPTQNSNGLSGMYLVRPITVGVDVYCKEENKICLSKEELIGIINDSVRLGMKMKKALNDGISMDSQHDIGQFINQLIR